MGASHHRKPLRLITIIPPERAYHPCGDATNATVTANPATSVTAIVKGHKQKRINDLLP